LRALGRDGESLEDVVVAALGAYEAEQLWAAAEAAAVAETTAQRTERERVKANVDRWMDAAR